MAQEFDLLLVENPELLSSADQREEAFILCAESSRSQREEDNVFKFPTRSS